MNIYVLCNQTANDWITSFGNEMLPHKDCVIFCHNLIAGLILCDTAFVKDIPGSSGKSIFSPVSAVVSLSHLMDIEASPPIYVTLKILHPTHFPFLYFEEHGYCCIKIIQYLKKKSFTKLHIFADTSNNHLPSLNGTLRCLKQQQQTSMCKAA